MSLGEVWVTLCFDFLGEVFGDSEGLKCLAFLLFPGNGWGCGLALFGGGSFCDIGSCIRWASSRVYGRVQRIAVWAPTIGLKCN